MQRCWVSVELDVVVKNLVTTSVVDTRSAGLYSEEPKLALPQKLLELWRYECARAPGAFADAVYAANAHVLLHDDPCFRLESRDADGALTLQLLDPDRTEVAPGEPALPCPSCSGTPPTFAMQAHAVGLAVELSPF